MGKILEKLLEEDEWDVLRFGPIDAGEPGLEALIQAIRSRRESAIIPRGRTIVNFLSPSLEDYRASKSFKRIESYERRFLRQPGAEIKFVSNPDPEETNTLLSELGTIEQASWLAAAGGDMRFSSDTDRAFWTRAMATGLSAGRHFQAWLAYIDGKPVAFRVVLSSGTASYMIANQYDQAAARHRLGWVLYLQNLRDAVESKVSSIDFAPGDLHYKGRLGGEEAEMRMDLYLCRPSFRGRALAGAVRGVDFLKRTLEARPWGRRLASRLPRI
ncbi:MAG: GNAT family N-acetyltransferase [Xanthomonadales bacterium]|nr:GNAT family N-acetyltransferase [Xanthomonadales bacterium]